MPEPRAIAQRELKNRSSRGGVSASRPARKESSKFTFEREEPGKPAEVGGRELKEVREVDPDGRIVVHHRTVDTLGKMLRAGTIDQAMHDAARDFQAAFTIANLDPIRAAAILRVPGAGREPDLNERQLDARRRVHVTMEALGGINSPAGSCVWHVIGCGCSIRQWAIRQGWNGRPVRQEHAQGILIAALGVLAAHFGYGETRRAS
jgi:hypothetical protein